MNFLEEQKEKARIKMIVESIFFIFIIGVLVWRYFTLNQLLEILGG